MKKKQNTSNNTLNKREQFSLRMSLLRYWFVKNIFVFIWSAFIICIGLTFSGLITENTPVLGVIFGDLSAEIRDVIDEVGGNFTLYTILESLISLGIVIGLCAKKLKAITFEDIKSRKCKILLIKAGLYFNENGKLTKRVETVTKTDINRDGLIGEEKAEKIQKEETIVEGLKRAGEEFVTIVTLDLSDVKKDQTEEIYKTTDLSETKIGVDDIHKEVTKDTKKLFGIKDEDSDKLKKKKLFSGARTFFQDLKKALSLTSKTEEEKRADELRKAKKKEDEEKERQAKELAKQKAKEAKERAEKEKELQEQKEKEEKARIKQLETKKKELKKEAIKKVEENHDQQENTQYISKPVSEAGSVQSQLSALLKNKK